MTSSSPPRDRTRRDLLQAALGTTLGTALGSLVPTARAQSTDPRNARPRSGDVFVFESGERKGARVALADLPLGGPPVMAYPLDAASGVVRDGTRLNQVMLIRMQEADLSEAARARAAQGVVAFSAVCSHAGCFDWGWNAEKKTLQCPCHESVFDAKDDARVLDGPAPRRLARLPVKVVDGVPTADGEFVGRVGFQPG